MTWDIAPTADPGHPLLGPGDICAPPMRVRFLVICGFAICFWPRLKLAKCCAATNADLATGRSRPGARTGFDAAAEPPERPRSRFSRSAATNAAGQLENAPKLGADSRQIELEKPRSSSLRLTN